MVVYEQAAYARGWVHAHVTLSRIGMKLDGSRHIRELNCFPYLLTLSAVLLLKIIVSCLIISHVLLSSIYLTIISCNISQDRSRALEIKLETSQV